MRYACRTGYHQRCPGRWCTCGCLIVALAVLFLGLYIAGSLLTAAIS